jgi:acyl-CoA dehydrogenase
VNFTLDETQAEISRLAADLLTARVTPARVEAVGSTDDRFDADLWRELATTGLLGVAVPEDLGGLGLGVVEAALVCLEVGRSVAPVPYVASTCAAAVLSAHGDDDQRRQWLPRIAGGDAVVVAVPPTSVRARVEDGVVDGRLVGVPWAHVADTVVVCLDDAVVLVDPRQPGVVAGRGETTAREVALDLTLTGVPAQTVGGAHAATYLRHCWLAMLAATQAGVTEAALRMTADYTSRREQFGKPLSTFQAVATRAADAYIDTQAIRATALQAAWLLAAGADAAPAVLPAAWWAAEGGQRCVHATQHLHGGMGADVTYPVHRYFLWGKQIELMCGGASALLADLGDELASRPEAGDALVLD